MKHTRNQQLEQQSIFALGKMVTDAGWLFYGNKNPDKGIDAEINIVEKEEVINKAFWVQVKAKQKIDENKKIKYAFETDHLKYWEYCQLPVFLVFWCKTSNVFYYIFVQKYIDEILNRKDSKWRKQKTKTLYFQKDSKFTQIDLLSSIVTAGALYVTQKQIFASSNIQGFLNGIPESNNDTLKERTLKGINFIKMQEYQNAVNEFEGILRDCTVHTSCRMSILLFLANSHFFLCNYKEALKYYTSVNDLYSKISGKDSLKSYATSINNIGSIHKAKGEYDKALEYYQKSLKIVEEIGDQATISISISNIGSIYYSEGDYDKAFEYYQKSLKIAEEIGDLSGIAITYNNIGSIYDSEAEYDKALEYYQKSFKIFEEIGNRLGIANSFNNIGSIYYAKMEYDNALEYYQKSLKINEEIGNRAGLAKSFNNIGVIYRVKKEYEIATEFYLKALKIQVEIGNLDDIAASYNNIGLVHKVKGEFEKALEYFQKSRHFVEEIGNLAGLATSYQNIGSIYEAKGDLDNALEYYQKSFKILEKIGKCVNMVTSYANISGIYKDKQDLNKAIENLKKAHQLAIEFKLPQSETYLMFILAYSFVNNVLEEIQKIFFLPKEQGVQILSQLPEGEQKQELLEIHEIFHSI